MRFPASAPRLLQIQSVRLTSADVGFFHPHTVIYSRAPTPFCMSSPALSSLRRAWLTLTLIRTHFEDLSNDAECLEDPPFDFAVFPVYLVKAHHAHMNEVTNSQASSMYPAQRVYNQAREPPVFDHMKQCYPSVVPRGKRSEIIYIHIICRFTRAFPSSSPNHAQS